jgi:hypothetical protein
VGRSTTSSRASSVPPPVIPARLSG